ncbi:MAG: E3 binding domain-containing protein [Rubrobacteraceae bacterium]
MAKKKGLKKLRKAVEKLQEQNEALAGKVEEIRESQAASREEITTLLEELRDEPEPATPTISADDEIVADEDGKSASEPNTKKPKATQSAERKAKELGVNLVGIEGTGSRDRITVADVEKAAGKE